MNFSLSDWQKLRFPLIGLGIALILMTLLAGYAQKQAEAAQAQLAEQQGRLGQARQRYQASGIEKETIIKYLPLYQRLIEDGFVGEERRIEWVDALRRTHQDHKLFGIKYSIGMQEGYKPAFNLNLGAFELNRSVMKLELSMLHEGDLLTMLEGLDAAQTTPFIVRECEINQLTEVKMDRFSPNFMAICELDWLTVREPQVLGGL